jgi:hypothetical protein
LKTHQQIQDQEEALPEWLLQLKNDAAHLKRHSMKKCPHGSTSQVHLSSTPKQMKNLISLNCSPNASGGRNY